MPYLTQIVNLDLIGRKYKEVDEHGRLSHHWLAERKLKTRTHSLGMEPVLFSLAPEEARSLDHIMIVYAYFLVPSLAGHTLTNHTAGSIAKNKRLG